MKLFDILTEKSWESRTDLEADSSTFATEPQRVALVFFLCVATVLFGLFITAYFIRMELDDWRPMPESTLLWLNTGVLFLASVALQWTRMLLDGPRRDRLKLGLLAGGLLTFGFVFGQFSAWQEMNAAGYFLSSNPANAFFYVLTGIHALHILGGLWVWTRASIRVWSGAEAEEVRLAVELCTVYWHFLLLVWLLLFALLSYT